jgi:hypothetical protein
MITSEAMPERTVIQKMDVRGLRFLPARILIKMGDTRFEAVMSSARKPGIRVGDYPKLEMGGTLSSRKHFSL